MYGCPACLILAAPPSHQHIIMLVGSLRAGGDTESVQVGWASAHRPQARLLKVGREEGGESVLFPSLLVTSIVTGAQAGDLCL